MATHLENFNLCIFGSLCFVHLPFHEPRIKNSESGPDSTTKAEFKSHGTQPSQVGPIFYNMENFFLLSVMKYGNLSFSTQHSLKMKIIVLLGNRKLGFGK